MVFSHCTTEENHALGFSTRGFLGQVFFETHPGDFSRAAGVQNTGLDTSTTSPSTLQPWPTPNYFP